KETIMYGKTLLTAVAFIAFAGSTFAAPVASNPDQVSVAVGIGDLNLAGQPGAAVALRRIHAAARSICGPAPDIRDLGRTADYRDCMAASMGPAVASLNNPLVTALYTGRDERTAMLQTASR
ncbi:MAG TPA: UrcA family protein, partial [Caulobacteraceae bacterium]